jgi:hypothetical protein
MLDLLVQQLARQIADARLEVGDHSRREGPRDEGSQLSVARASKKMNHSGLARFAVNMLELNAS